MIEISFNNKMPKKFKWSYILTVFLIFWLPYSVYLSVDYYLVTKVKKEKTLLDTISEMNSIRIEPGIQYHDDSDYQEKYYHHKFLLQQVKVLVKELGKETEYQALIKEHEGLFNIGKTRYK